MQAITIIMRFAPTGNHQAVLYNKIPFLHHTNTLLHTHVAISRSAPVTSTGCWFIKTKVSRVDDLEVHLNFGHSL